MHLYRGITKDKPHRWVYGFYWEAQFMSGNPENPDFELICYIHDIDDMALTSIEVIEETVAISTGQKDKNKRDIYCDDYIASPDECLDYCLVEWDKSLACFQINGYGKQMYHNEGGGEEYSNGVSRIEDNVLLFGDSSAQIEVTGTIHDHLLSQDA